MVLEAFSAPAESGSRSGHAMGLGAGVRHIRSRAEPSRAEQGSRKRGRAMRDTAAGGLICRSLGTNLVQSALSVLNSCDNRDGLAYVHSSGSDFCFLSHKQGCGVQP